MAASSPQLLIKVHSSTHMEEGYTVIPYPHSGGGSVLDHAFKMYKGEEILIIRIGFGVGKSKGAVFKDRNSLQIGRREVSGIQGAKSMELRVTLTPDANQGSSLFQLPLLLLAPQHLLPSLAAFPPRPSSLHSLEPKNVKGSMEVSGSLP